MTDIQQQEKARARARDIAILTGELDVSSRRRDLAFQRAVRDKVIDLKHPAKFSQVILEKIREILDGITGDWDYEPLVFDPFAGVGGIHHLRRPDADGQRYHTIGLEIEWEWCALGRQHGPMITADFFKFEWDREFWGAPDIICTSPVYGNRFSDNHRAKDGSVRRSYTHDLGRRLTPGNSGEMQWGKKYRAFHRKAWLKCCGILDVGGYLVLNVSDHERNFKTVPVALWHHDTMLDVGFELVQEHEVVTPRMKMGQNHEARARCEMVYVFRKPETTEQ